MEILNDMTTIILMILSLNIYIFINFSTGYFKSGLIIMDRQKIIRHYLKKYFFSDLLA